MIVDAHTHLLPDRLAAKIRAFFNTHIEDGLVYPYGYQEAKAAILAAGVDRCWSLPYAHKGGIARDLNRWMAETFAADPAVVPGGTLHPEDDVEGVLREALDELQLPVLKLHCSVGRFRTDDERLSPLWRRVSESGHPVVVHVGHAVDGTTADDDLAPVAAVAADWPEARLIVAHCGAPAVSGTLALMRQHRSLYADLTPVVTDPVLVPPLAAAELADRLLMGSDAPNVAISIEAALAAVKAFGLPAAAEAAVLGGNAERLRLRQ